MIDPAVSLALRLALAPLFAQAAWHKLAAFAEFRAALEGYRVLPRRAAPFASFGVIAAEACAAPALLFAPRVGGAAAAALLALYTGAIAINLVRGRRDIACGCGGPGLRQPLSGALVARNLALVAAALACSVAPGPRELVALDALSVAGAASALSLLYAATNRLIANAPRLAALGSGA